MREDDIEIIYKNLHLDFVNKYFKNKKQQQKIHRNHNEWYKIHISSFDYSIYIFEDEENNFVAIKGNKIIGCTSFNGNTARKMKHYGTIGISVLKEYWGRGIATALLEKLISWSKEKGIKKINLDVFENNERAIKLYEKFGFKLEGCIEDGIFDGENYINLLVYGLKIW